MGLSTTDLWLENKLQITPLKRQAFNSKGNCLKRFFLMFQNIYLFEKQSYADTAN